MSFIAKVARIKPVSSSLRQSTVCAFSSRSLGAEVQEVRVYPVYVHHLSKIVLEHLQDARVDWVEEQGLHKGLRLNSDGTFVLRFPPTTDESDGGRIWTSYDAAKKQHWLSVYREKLVGRFLIKDSVAHVEGHGSEAVEGSVRLVVDQMIRTLSGLENQLSHQPR